MIFTYLSFIISVILLGVIVHSFNQQHKVVREHKSQLIFSAALGVLFIVGQANVIVKLMIEMMQ